MEVVDAEELGAEEPASDVVVVPLKVTVVSVPELASKVITELFAPPAETGNV